LVVWYGILAFVFLYILLKFVNKIKNSSENIKKSLKRAIRDFFNYIITGFIGGYVAIYLNYNIQNNRYRINANQDTIFFFFVLSIINLFLLYLLINEKRYNLNLFPKK